MGHVVGMVSPFDQNAATTGRDRVTDDIRAKKDVRKSLNAT